MSRDRAPDRSALDAIAACAVGELHREVGDDGRITLHRLPEWALRRVSDPRLAAMVAMPAGVRLDVVTDATCLELEVQLTLVQRHDRAPVSACFDVVEGSSARVGRYPTRMATTVHVDLDGHVDAVVPRGPATVRLQLAGRTKRRVEIWLPRNAVVQLVDARVAHGATVEPAPQHGPVWVHHGSSISHCLDAAGPTDAWPVMVARRAGVSLRDLSFAGECHLDAFVARAIRDVAADAISLELGVNVVNGDTMRERAFVPAAHGFLDTVRDGHPSTPIVVVSPIHARLPRPTVPGGGALTLERVRSLLAEVVAGRRAAGDQALRLVDGRQLLGESDAARLVDGLHPDARGNRQIGDRFHRITFDGGPFAAPAPDQLLTNGQ